MARISAHEVRKLAFWRAALAAPFESRIGIGAPEVVEFLELDAIKNDIPERPRIAKPSAQFLADVRAAVAQLPAVVKSAVASRFAGIYMVDDIGSTGFTDEIRDESGKAVAGFIVLDGTVLEKRTANEWATWREGTPFKPRPGYSLAATIEPKRSDNRVNAIQYIVLHELGHVLSIGNDVHPTWIGPPAQPRSGEYPYFDFSWGVGDDKYITRFDDRFPQRKDIVYYWGPRIDMKDAAETYSRLEQTDFASLYAATHPADDFAEAFASYVHTQLMGKPFEIAIRAEGRPEKRFTACWSQPRCADKKRWFDRRFGR